MSLLFAVLFYIFGVVFNLIYLSAQLSAGNFILFLNYDVRVLQRSFFVGMN